MTREDMLDCNFFFVVHGEASLTTLPLHFMIDTDEFLELESSSDQTISDILLEHEINSPDVAAAFHYIVHAAQVC